MARGKKATALFEVIHTAKKPPRSSPSATVPAPKWWNRGKARPAAAETASHFTESTGPGPGSSSVSAGSGTLAAGAPDPVRRRGSWLAAARRDSAAVGSKPVAPVELPVESVDENHQANDLTDSTGTIAASASVNDPTQSIAPRAGERFADRFARKAAAARTAAPVSSEPAAVDAEPPITAATPDTVASTAGFDNHSNFDEPEAPAIAAQTTDFDDEHPAADPEPVLPKKRSTAGRPAPRRGSGEFHLNLSLGGIIAIAFILVLLLVITFLIGQRGGGVSLTQLLDPHPSDKPEATGETQVKAGDKYAVKLTDPGDGSAGLMIAGVPEHAVDAAKPDDAADKPTQHGPVIAPNPVHAASIAKAVPAREVVQPAAPPARVVGMTYIVVQSYPDLDTAKKACEFLNKKGISCSLVRTLAAWAPRGWYSVVGNEPLNSKDPAIADSERVINDLGLEFSSSSLNQFQPRPYVWQADSDEAGLR